MPAAKNSIILNEGEKASVERRPGGRFAVRLFDKDGHDRGLAPDVALGSGDTLTIGGSGRNAILDIDVNEFMPRLDVRTQHTLGISGRSSIIIAAESTKRPRLAAPGGASPQLAETDGAFVLSAGHTDGSRRQVVIEKNASGKTGGAEIDAAGNGRTSYILTARDTAYGNNLAGGRKYGLKPEQDAAAPAPVRRPAPGQVMQASGLQLRNYWQNQLSDLERTVDSVPDLNIKHEIQTRMMEPLKAALAKPPSADHLVRLRKTIAAATDYAHTLADSGPSHPFRKKFLAMAEKAPGAAKEAGQGYGGSEAKVKTALKDASTALRGIASDKSFNRTSTTQSRKQLADLVNPLHTAAGKAYLSPTAETVEAFHEALKDAAGKAGKLREADPRHGMDAVPGLLQKIEQEFDKKMQKLAPQKKVGMDAAMDRAIAQAMEAVHPSLRGQSTVTPAGYLADKSAPLAKNDKPLAPAGRGGPGSPA